MTRKLHILLPVLLALLCLCSGCRGDADNSQTVPETTEPRVIATAPAPGNPEDVTCKGSYTAEEFDPKAVAATLGDQKLTNGQLQVWFDMAVAAYRQEGHDAMPDFSAGLDVQVCPIDDTVGSWQQYFLREALENWHSAAALKQQSADVPFPTEKEYQPNPEDHEQMADMLATKWLYGYHPYFEPNSIHQAYLDSLPDVLAALAAEKGFSGLGELAQAMGISEADLTGAAELYNYGYMYFTRLSYDVSVPEEAFAAAGGEKTVTVRHILLTPETDEELAWQSLRWDAERMLKSWEKGIRRSEGSFAALASKHSSDTATARDGGAYPRIRRGQLMEALDSWCFDDARQPGDTTVLQTELGYHLLYFSGSSTTGAAEEEQRLLAEAQVQLIRKAKDAYPADIRYEDITLHVSPAVFSFSDVLYPDLAHERYPEVPLYLQQDYGETLYGNYSLAVNGCGITCLAMAASYMNDEEITPPELCRRYGNYSHESGTDAMIYHYEAPVLGFYLKEQTYQPTVAQEALSNGHIAISLQSKGYWTRGGHYVLLEKMNEDGTVQVRDSNLPNYGKIEDHCRDRHTWRSVTSTNAGFWIFEKKITTIPACGRCGDPQSRVEGLFTGDYYCRRCAPALLRRDAYLSASAE